MANIENVLQAAIRALQERKDKNEARALLEKVLEKDDNNPEAWLWMSVTVDDPEEKIICLQNVLTLDPNNTKARKGLKALGVNPDQANEDAAAFESATSPPPFMTDDTNFNDFNFNEVDNSPEEERGFIEPPVTSSASSGGRYNKVQDYTGEQMDSWISNLGIQSPPTSSSDKPFQTGTLGDLSDFSDINFDEPPAPIAPPAPPIKRAPPPPLAPQEWQDDAEDLLEDFMDNDFDESSHPQKPVGFDFDEDIDDDPEEEDVVLAAFNLIPDSISAGAAPASQQKYPLILWIFLGLAVLTNVAGLGMILIKSI